MPAIPFTISFTVPSPPTATRSDAPRSAALRASSPSSPGRLERSASPASPSSRARRSRDGQRRPVAPFADAGLTRKTVWPLMFGRDRGECDPGHAIDGSLELVVRDPREVLADHDVADREQAACLDAPQRADCKKDGRLHLNREDAAGRPALVAFRIGVVEGVARGDRADPQRLLELLGRVHGAVHELPVGSRTVWLSADVVPRGSVRRYRSDRDDQVAKRQVGLEPATGSDAHQSLDAELNELLDHDRGRRTAHARRLHGDGPALVCARVTEQPALVIALLGVVEILL